VFDHFYTLPEPSDEITFESLTTLAAFAALTRRVMAEFLRRCEAEGRDPATLRFSLDAKDANMQRAGERRVDLLAGYREVGLDRLVAFPTRWSPTQAARAAFAEDIRKVGMELSGPVSPAG
jgi:hypothetical protein